MKNHISTNDKQEPYSEINERNAYHQAGYAAAIYFGNRRKQLPAINFQIIKEHHGASAEPFKHRQSRYTVKVEGNSLIQKLAVSLPEITQHHRPQDGYRCDFEMDVINLLIGSLAEAKYVALRDDEIFNANLVHLGALHFYGGGSSLDIITEYMKHFIHCDTERNQKLCELFMAAYSFVNKKLSWMAITTLAEFIMLESHNVIENEKVISVLESRLVA